ncbi:MAG TPA: hypothetical protein PLR50_14935, partial [Candidatus Rifleibacterium sp.]|nr:hypothetical protein [Candidatus Rifleibacterium sp.]
SGDVSADFPDGPRRFGRWSYRWGDPCGFVIADYTKTGDFRVACFFSKIIFCYKVLFCSCRMM